MNQAIRQIIIPDNLVFPKKDQGVNIDCSQLAVDGVVFIGDDGTTMWVEKEPFTGRITDYDFTEAMALWEQAESMLSVQVPEPEPLTPEQKAEEARAERDYKIQSIRWRIERHHDELALGLEPSEPLEPLLEYVQKLRDVPQQEGFPENFEWPTDPLEDSNAD